MIRSTWRTARKARRCGCGNSIAPRERYLEHVMSPDHGDLGGPCWQRIAECSPCAQRYGRGEQVAS